MLAALGAVWALEVEAGPEGRPDPEPACLGQLQRTISVRHVEQTVGVELDVEDGGGIG